MLASCKFRLSTLSTAAAALLTVASLALSGCGMGITANPVSEAVTGNLQVEGTVFGGSTPISGATVTIWETDPASTGYPAAIHAAAATQGAKLKATTYSYGAAFATSTLTTTGSADGVASIAINNGGGGYSSATPPTVTIAAPATGTTATATATVVNGTITAINVTNAGTGYTSAPAVTIAAPAGTAGGFSFSGTSYTCDAATGTTATGGSTAGPFLYLVATGGNTGGGQNNNSVLVNALGSCSYLLSTVGTSNIHVAINEATTLAAAYALGNFMYVDNTTPGSQKVYIGAPANNNAATGSCTGTGSSMVCAAAGLKHGFYNAYNLVDGICVNGSACAASQSPTGAARTTIVANTDAGTAANPNASIPQAEIHAIANVMTNCVNSVGGSGTGGTGSTTDGTGCGNFFSKTPDSSGNVPVDTLTAAINLAHNPASNVSALYGYVPPNPAYVPTLSLQPYDWSIAITYNGLAVGGTASNFGFASTAYPEYVALDANDNVYVLAGSASTFANSTTSALSSMTSSGAGIWANASTVDGAQGCYPGVVALDTNGNVWNSYQPPSAKTCNSAILGRSAASGGAATTTLTSSTSAVVQTSTDAIAFDRYNNMWAGRNTSSATTGLWEYPYSAGGYGAQIATAQGNKSPSTGTVNDVTNIQIDSKSNVFATMYNSSSTGYVWVFPNLNAANLATTPTYGITGAATSSGSLSYLTQILQTSKSGAMALDPSGNIWAGETSTDFNRIVPTVNSSVITALTNNTVAVSNSAGTGPGTPGIGQIDSNGTFWFPSFTSSGQLWFFPTSTASTITSKVLLTCYAPNGATTCTNVTYTGTPATTPGSPSSTTAGPTVVQIDSTGSIWMSAETAGNVIQIVGSASPMWPQLSYGVFATKPQ